MHSELTCLLTSVIQETLCFTHSIGYTCNHLSAHLSKQLKAPKIAHGVQKPHVPQTETYSLEKRTFVLNATLR